MFYTIQNSSYFTLRFIENLFHIPQNTLGSINLKDLNYSIEFGGHPERSDSKIVESRNTANESSNNV